MLVIFNLLGSLDTKRGDNPKSNDGKHSPNFIIRGRNST